MLSEQPVPLFLKSLVTMLKNVPHGTKSPNCQIGAEAARALQRDMKDPEPLQSELPPSGQYPPPQPLSKQQL